jgi:DNA-binding beta-propeller fold protein YncE
MKREINDSRVTVSTLAGSSVEGYADGSGAEAQFYLPTGIAVDSVGNVYVADLLNHRIRKISPTGDVSTLAGGGIRAAAKICIGVKQGA